MIIDKATNADFPEVLAVLRECGLPEGSLTVGDMEAFLVARSGRCIVGVAGLVVQDNVAVGHSLAVVPGFRGLGLGRNLAQRLMDAAADLGLDSVYLFTCRAEFYFRAMGFSVVKHEEVPRLILSVLHGLCHESTVEAGHILCFPLVQHDSQNESVGEALPVMS
jgi:N-acetylglutamate synthase-like GNAT family acetyltransferase